MYSKAEAAVSLHTRRWEENMRRVMINQISFCTWYTETQHNDALCKSVLLYSIAASHRVPMQGHFLVSLLDVPRTGASLEPKHIVVAAFRSHVPPNASPESNTDEMHPHSTARGARCQF